MPKTRLSWRLIALCLLGACGPGSVDGVAADRFKPAAIEVPTHVLTVERAGTVVEAEAGDWIEVHLPEPDAPQEWEPKSASALEIDGPPAGETRESEDGTLRVFRYSTRQVGRAGLSFALRNPEDGGPPDRIVEFTVAVR